MLLTALQSLVESLDHEWSGALRLVKIELAHPGTNLVGTGSYSAYNQRDLRECCGKSDVLEDVISGFAAKDG